MKTLSAITLVLYLFALLGQIALICFGFFCVKSEPDISVMVFTLSIIWIMVWVAIIGMVFDFWKVRLPDL